MSRPEGWRPRRTVTLGDIDSAYWIALGVEVQVRGGGTRFADVIEAGLDKEFGAAARATLEQLHRQHGKPPPPSATELSTSA